MKDNKIVVGCLVSNYFNSKLSYEGIVIGYDKSIPWGYNIKIKLTHDVSVFEYKKGDVIECRLQDLTYISYKKVLKNVIIATEKPFYDNSFLDITGLVKTKYPHGFINIGFKDTPDSILGQFSHVRIKDDCLITNITFYDWQDKYAIFYPAVSIRIKERDQDIPEKIIKYEIYQLSLLTISHDKNKIKPLFNYLNSSDKKRINNLNAYTNK